MASQIEGHWGALLNPIMHKKEAPCVRNGGESSPKNRLTAKQYMQARDILKGFAEKNANKKEALAALKANGLIITETQARRYIDSIYLNHRAMLGYPVKRRSTPTEEVRTRMREIIQEYVEKNMTNAALAEKLLEEDLYGYYDPHYIRSYASRVRRSLGLPRIKHSPRGDYERKKL